MESATTAPKPESITQNESIKQKLSMSVCMCKILQYQ